MGDNKNINPYSDITNRITPCCNIDACAVQFTNYYENETDVPVWIHVMDFTKQSDSSGTYYAYSIRATDFNGQLVIDCMHRYSDFESLHKLLRYRYQSLVVPPIPEKHTIADYATKQSKAKDDPTILDRRKRLLQSFLNRLVRHPILGRDHAVHQFFIKDAVWADVLVKEGLPALIKQRKSAISKALERQTPHLPNQQFLAAEEYTEKFSIEIATARSALDKATGRIRELSVVFGDLGHAYNSCSLNENSPLNSESSALAQCFEKLGAVFDASVPSTKQLALQLEESFSEPLSEYAQFCTRIQTLLLFPKKKQLELEQTISNIEVKKNSLATLERSEAEAQRIASVLRTASSQAADTALPVASTKTATPELATSPSTDIAQTAASNRDSIRSSSSSANGGLLASINALIDNDPDTTRRNAICKTRDRIIELENDKARLIRELQETEQSLQPDLNRFQLEKIRDLRKMILDVARAQAKYAQENKALWLNLKHQ